MKADGCIDEDDDDDEMAANEGDDDNLVQLGGMPRACSWLWALRPFSLYCLVFSADTSISNEGSTPSVAAVSSDEEDDDDDDD